MKKVELKYISIIQLNSHFHLVRLKSNGGLREYKASLKQDRRFEIPTVF